MAIIPIFHGRVGEDGRLSLLASEQQARRGYLSTLRGKPVEVIVRKIRRQRTSPQNKYIHAVPIPILSEHFGSDLVETKRDLMGACWGWEFNERLGREIPIRSHTSAMSDEECTYFIDWVVPWALVNHGVVIPLPGEAEEA